MTSQRVREIVPCPRRGCGGSALAELECPDVGTGSLRERTACWILDCGKCGYWGPNRED